MAPLNTRLPARCIMPPDLNREGRQDSWGLAGIPPFAAATLGQRFRPPRLAVCHECQVGLIAEIVRDGDSW